MSRLVNTRKQHLDKNFEDLTREDVIKWIGKVNTSKKHADKTKESFKACLKKFLTWKEYRNETPYKKPEFGYPDIAKPIICGSSRKMDRKNRKTYEDILTRDELKKIRLACRNNRDLALICLLENNIIEKHEEAERTYWRLK